VREKEEIECEKGDIYRDSHRRGREREGWREEKVSNNSLVNRFTQPLEATVTLSAVGGLTFFL
jgi:hypothetical protein